VGTIDEGGSNGSSCESECGAPAPLLVVGGEAANGRRELRARRVGIQGRAALRRQRQSNANLLFTWRRQEGRSNAVGGAERLQLLPVTVADADAGTAAGAAATQSQVGRMEIVLNSGERIVVGADVDASSLARVVKALSRR
jgi:hypothetical protein